MGERDARPLRSRIRASSKALAWSLRALDEIKQPMIAQAADKRLPATVRAVYAEQVRGIVGREVELLTKAGVPVEAAQAAVAAKAEPTPLPGPTRPATKPAAGRNGVHEGEKDIPV